MQGVAGNIGNGRPSLGGGGSVPQDPNNGTQPSTKLEEMLRQTTRDNMQLK